MKLISISSAKEKMNFVLEYKMYGSNMIFRSGMIPHCFLTFNADPIFPWEEKLKSVQHVSRLFNSSLPASLFEFLKKISTHNLKAVYYGWMFSRQSKGIRLTLNGIKVDQLMDTLIWLGWEGNYDSIKRLQKNYLNNDQQIVLAFDFDGQISQRFGIEVFDKHATQFANLLRRNKIMDDQQLRLLSEWTCSTELYPDTASTLSALYGRDITQIYKRINHFKFVLDQADFFKTKAYLYYCF